ncbi:MAG: ATP-binding protein, partial [Rubrivivax sp.]
VLPVLMAGVLMPRLLALGIAAAASLMLLAGALGDDATGDATLALTRAGLAGLGFFAIAVLASELAARLTREEASARDSMELARRQAQLNRLVIQEMEDGVLVVDRGLRVRAANPAARGLLVPRGLAPPAPFDLRSRRAWKDLAHAVERAMTQAHWPEAGREVALVFDDGERRSLRLRMRFTRPSNGVDPGLPPDPYGVLLLEDSRTTASRLRQEHLAAMGRVSAGVAHEIRNPLAAISQANELLLEDTLRPDQRRLAQIVADNARRLQRLVDEVMELAPGHASQAPPVIDAREVVAATAADWVGTAGLPLGPTGRLHATLPARPLGVRFDAEHLRRILVNLLDNALRHASDAPGSIELRMAEAGPDRVALQVLSDGEPISPDVERHLFEPFFSTRSRGSGLGLYICRELCERYGASIDFRLRPAHERLRNAFVILLRRAPLTTTPDADLLLTP